MSQTSAVSKLIIFRTIFAVALIFVTLLFGEILCRILFDQITTKAGRWAVGVAQSETFLGYDDVDGSIDRPRLIPHPYLLFQATPNLKNGAGAQHNSMGYRDKEFDVEKKTGVKRILALGGSTTYGAGVSLPQNTWPAQLQNLLDKKPLSEKYEVINGGLDSASSPEILAGWIFRFRHLHPDIVILNMGVNDIWPILLTSKYSPEYVNFRKAVPINKAGKVLRPLLKRFYLVKAIYAFGWDDLDLQPFQQVLEPSIYKEEENNKGVTKRIVETENIGFERNLEELLKVIKLDGAKVYMTMEPALSEDLIVKKVSGTTFQWIVGLEHPWTLGLHKNFDLMTKIALENQVPFLRMKSDTFKYDWFVDWYHLNNDGEKEKARLIKEGLEKANLIVSHS